MAWQETCAVSNPYDFNCISLLQTVNDSIVLKDDFSQVRLIVFGYDSTQFRKLGQFFYTSNPV